MSKLLFIIIFISALVIVSCKEDSKSSQIEKDKIEKVSSKVVKSAEAMNLELIGNPLLKNYNDRITYYFSKYQSDTCDRQKDFESSLLAQFEGFKQIGDLNQDKKNDSVFVLPPMTFCEEGQSYYFSDISLPRLLTDSYCCHPVNIFSIGDIDEDGIAEVGQYYSSCASRYKALVVYSLKKDEWRQVGHCIFDLRYSGHETNFNNYIRKISKGKFEMLEITDLTEDRSKIGQKNWLRFKI